MIPKWLQTGPQRVLFYGREFPTSEAIFFFKFAPIDSKIDLGTSDVNVPDA